MSKMAEPFFVKVDIYSDTMCPWCFIGKRRLENAMKDIEEKQPGSFRFEIEWHPYLLYPNIQPEGIDRGEAPASKKIAAIAVEARKVGIDMGRARYVPNTVNSHRLLHYCLQQKGRVEQNKLADLLFVANFVESRNLSDTQVLVDCGVEVGLSETEIRTYLDSDTDRQLIIDQDAVAHTSHAMTGVPVFIFNNKFKMPGAQDELVFLNVFQRLKDRNIVFDPKASPPSL